MTYKIIRTDIFEKAFKAFKDARMFNELDEKIQRLKNDPINVGKRLTGKYYGFFCTRLPGHYRLIFRINETEKIVYLEGLKPRKHAYE